MKLSAKIVFGAMLVGSLASNGCRSRMNQSEVKEKYNTQEFESFFESKDWVETNFKKLPDSGALPHRVWNGHYWPGYRGGLTNRYFGFSMSPIEKFELAFKDQLAKDNAHYRFGDLTFLEHRRTKKSSKDWYGICDGSSEAALNLEEPTQVQTINGVKFYPFEIKALLAYFTAMSSDQRRALFAGNRVRFEDPMFEEDGRGYDWRYRDVNPGLFHLALTNYLAIKHRGIVADIVPTNVVLNFPIKGFRILEKTDVTDPTEVAAIGKHTTIATSFVKLRVEVHYGDSHRVLENIPNQDATMTIVYDYSLELDQDGSIVGGEWLGESRANHPDFLWLAREKDLNLMLFEAGRLAIKKDKVTMHDEIPDENELRLTEPFKVGNAVLQLINGQADPNSDVEVMTLRNSQDNWAGYQYFAGKKDPPLPKSMEVKAK